MRKGKQVKSIPENELYSEIIFSIVNENNYLQKIARSTKSNPSNTLKKLRYMEKQGYLISHKEGDKNVFPFERRIYEINYSRILKDFVRYFIEKGLDYYTKSGEYPAITSKLTPLLDAVEKDMVNPEKNNQLKEHLIIFIQHFSQKKRIIKGKEMPKTLLEPFFFLYMFIMDLTEEESREKIIKKAKEHKDLDKLMFLLELGNAIKDLKKEYTKQYELAKEEWIKKKYGKLINRFDDYEKQFGTKTAWELTFKKKNTPKNSLESTKPTENKGKGDKEK